MRLRVLPGDDAALRAPSLMLSPDAMQWCRLDGPRIAPLHGADSSTVVLTGAERAQVGGLLDLRDGDPVQLYATPAVFEHLTQVLPVLQVLEQFCGVHWHLIPVAGERRAADFAIDDWPHLVFTALTPEDVPTGSRIALAVRDEASGGRLFVAQGASLDSEALEWISEADCVVIDQAPDDVAWLERFAQLPTARKLLLDPRGHDRAQLAARGIECVNGTALEIDL